MVYVRRQSNVKLASVITHQSIIMCDKLCRTKLVQLTYKSEATLNIGTGKYHNPRHSKNPGKCTCIIDFSFVQIDRIVHCTIVYCTAA